MLNRLVEQTLIDFKILYCSYSFITVIVTAKIN